MQINPAFIRICLVKKFFPGVHRDSNFRLWSRLSENCDIIPLFHFAFIHGDSRRDKNTPDISGRAGGNAHRKSQKGGTKTFIVFGIDAEDIISSGKAGESYLEVGVGSGDSGGGYLRVFQESDDGFWVRPAGKDDASYRYSSPATTPSASATSSATAAAG